MRKSKKRPHSQMAVKNPHVKSDRSLGKSVLSALASHMPLALGVCHPYMHSSFHWRRPRGRLLPLPVALGDDVFYSYHLFDFFTPNHILQSRLYVTLTYL